LCDPHPKSLSLRERDFEIRLPFSLREKGSRISKSLSLRERDLG